MPSNAPSRQSPRPEDIEVPTIVVLTLARFWFALAWTGVAAVRVASICFLFSIGWIYRAMVSTPGMEYYANFLSPHFASLFRPSSCVYFICSAAHAYQLLRTLLASLRVRALIFSNHYLLPTATYRCSSRTSQPSVTQRVQSWYKENAFFRFFFDRQGMFGAESRYFQQLFLIRELFEMSSQTAQVYFASSLIGRPWINHLYVGVFVINACSTPIIEHLVAHRSPALERVLCLASDMLLDSVMSIMLPSLIVGRYMLMFDTETQTFPASVLYSAVGFNRLVTENKQVLINSLGDLIVKLIPHFSIYSCLNTIQSLIRPDITSPDVTKVQDEATVVRGGAQQQKHRTRAPAHTNRMGPTAAQVTEVPRSTRVSRGPRKTVMMAARTMLFRSSLSMRIHHMQSQRLERRKAAFVHAVFCLWGFIVLTLHLAASYKAINDAAQPPGCLQSQRPWLTSRFACSVYKYNCSVHNTASPSDDSLAFLDENSVAALVFADCSALEMPSTLRKFRNLLGIDVWNSTIMAWEGEAALSSTHNPSMVYLIFLETNMTELPLGVLEDLPPQLTDVEVSHSNLAALPADLDERWSQVLTLYLEYCQFQEFPTVLTRMHIAGLSLVGNALVELPTMSSAAESLYGLWLSNNPLKDLPEDFGSDSNLLELSLDNTAIVKFPSWITTDATLPSTKLQVYAHNTPFCRTLPSDKIDAWYSDHAPVTCADVNPSIAGRYPVDIVKSYWI